MWLLFLLHWPRIIFFFCLIENQCLQTEQSQNYILNQRELPVPH